MSIENGSKPGADDPDIPKVDSTAVLGHIIDASSSRSMAASLRVAAAKGYLDKDNKRKAVVVISSAKKAKLEAKSYTIEEKRDPSQAGRGRPRGGQVHEVKPTEEYKPEITLEYTDDSGKKLETPKEAFRYMCHKFHGKGSGKNKIEKRLKKQNLETKVKEALASDAPPTSLRFQIERQRELKLPYVILNKRKQPPQT